MDSSEYNIIEPQQFIFIWGNGIVEEMVIVIDLN
jgi:hypothetical protein